MQEEAKRMNGRFSYHGIRNIGETEERSAGQAEKILPEKNLPKKVPTEKIPTEESSPEKALPDDGTAFALSVCREKGMTGQEAEHSRERFGDNALPRQKRTSFLHKLLAGFGDPIIRILIAALFINCLFLFKTFDILETAGILFAILAATLISALSERGGELAFDRLQEEISHTNCLCRRDGQNVRLPIERLCPGDLVLLSAGERVPADGILISGSLRVSLASLNGEAAECAREAQRPFTPEKWEPSDVRLLFRGASVIAGDGKMLVLRTGGQTLYGGLTRELQTETRESPLRMRLSKLARQMSRVGYCASAAVALVYLIDAFFLDAGCTLAGMKLLCSDPAFVFSSLTHALMLATTTIVVAVPEGLPMMISVVLSANIRRMQRDNVLVRKPVGIETAGSLNLLFCDKTGTLTRGAPIVSGILTADGRMYDSYASLKMSAPALAGRYLLSAYYNTQSRPAKGEDGVVRACGGNAADRAILDSVLRGASSPDNSLADIIRAKNIRAEKLVPFDSVKKYSSVTIDGCRYVKGAPEIVLKNVVSAVGADGRRVPLDRAALENAVRAVTTRAGRVLALCVEEKGELCFVLCVCIRDDLRRGARRAVKELQGAGVRVVMMTGDGQETAAAIARESGILPPGGLALSSAQLAEMTDEQVSAILPRLCVLSRALPGDKSRLVKLSQAAGLTVGMTGDGVNDAPALKIADVGFAMGSGTEVAQEAGDIVILDDNITSISRAVLYGRTIFKSIRKFIMFQMTTNLTAVGISVLCPLIGLDAPITVLQMLWVNMIMDTLGSLAFAGEAPVPDTMREKPKRREEPIMNRYMTARIAWMGLYLLSLCLWFSASPVMREHFGYYETPVRFLGAFFALFIFADICNSVSARTTHVNPFYRLSRNRAFLWIFSFIIAAQLSMIYFGGSVFRTCPLPVGDLFLILGLAATVLLFGAVLKGMLSLRFGHETL